MARSKEIPQSEYNAIHEWLRYHYGSAQGCENPECRGGSKKYEWALKQDARYEKKRENFMQLCKRCHYSYDFTYEALENMRRASFNANKTHCKAGHELTPENTYTPPGRSERRCLICKREGLRRWQKRHQERQEPIPCETCQRFFHPLRPGRRFCSNSCSASWRMSYLAQSKRVALIKD